MICTHETVCFALFSERTENDEMEGRQFCERIYNFIGKTSYNRLVMIKEINIETYSPRCGENY